MVFVIWAVVWAAVGLVVYVDARRRVWPDHGVEARDWGLAAWVLGPVGVAWYLVKRRASAR